MLMGLFVLMQSSSSALRTNDQYFSLTDQLNLGVRAVELDTHWVEVSLLQAVSACVVHIHTWLPLGHNRPQVVAIGLLLP